MKASPTFSIIVPVYNVKYYISQCVDSIKEQTFSDFECVLVDDGSTDGSSTFCDTLCKSDNRFRTIHIKNKGVSHARNVGIENTSGQFVIFVDSDDTLIPTALESYYKVMQSDASVDMIRGGYNILIDNVLGSFVCLDINQIYEDKSDLFNVLEETKYYSFVWNMCVRRSIIDNIRFDESLNWLEDHIFSYQCYLKCHKVYLLSDVLYNYNIRSDKKSLSKVQDPEVVYRAMEIEYALKNKLNNNKYPEQDVQISQNYRRNIHRIVCQLYYGKYPFSTRRKLSNKSLQIYDGLFREDDLFFNNSLPFLIRDAFIRLLLKIKGSFAPYE